jgi:hypothetical protein
MGKDKTPFLDHALDIEKYDVYEVTSREDNDRNIRRLVVFNKETGEVAEYLILGKLVP